MEISPTLAPRLSRIQSSALVVGVAATVICAIAALINDSLRVQFFRSYLIGYLFSLSLGLGCLSIAMLHHLTGGRWGIGIRRLLEAGMSTLPLLAVLFLPIAFGVHHIYEWSHADLVKDDPVLLKKAAYLNVEWFWIRAAIYFAVWLFFGFVINRWSMRRDTVRDARLTKRIQLLSGPGVLLYGLSITFASVDWAMSLEPHWFSTMYGVLFIIGNAVNAMAFVTAVAVLLHGDRPFSETMSINVFHDLGNLLLAFVMLWAYISFSQYLIVWSGNLPEETPWYVHRTNGGWQWLALALVALHFAAPFLLLLSRVTKRNPTVLARIAIWLVVMRWVDLFWLIKPAFDQHQRYPIHIHWLDLLTTAAVGGLWIAMFCWALKSRIRVPVFVHKH